MSYETEHRESIAQPEKFWAEQAKAIYWHKQPDSILDYSKPPFRHWFAGGETNLCYNAIDRHLVDRADQAALIAVSTETNTRKTYTYADMYREVNTFAAMLQTLDVGQGDRVVIYMPNVAEAVFAMLACARIGAIHSVVFGGFAAHNLALRIDDAKPKLLICADAGSRAGKVIPYKPLVDEACATAKHAPPKVLIVSRGLDRGLTYKEGRDHDYHAMKAAHAGREVAVAWLESNAPSYLLYTSGTTGKPKGVQRDVGGYAVALALSMRVVFDVGAGQTMFTTSDIGWAVGHSYNVYGPLIVGATCILYEGLPIHPDAGIWWQICEAYRVRSMFSSPTAIRILKKHDAAYLKKYDLSALKYLFLAGEPLDEPTARWIGEGIGKPIVDNYWQTETGWPTLTLLPGHDFKKIKIGSPGLPNFGFNARVINEVTGRDAAAGEKGVLTFVPPLPPGCMSTIWNDDARFLRSYFSHFKELLYSSLDWAIRDEDGYVFILGRTDDVINVAGHRLGTREIEESVATHPGVAEAAVVGVADELKGQVPIVFATLKVASTDPAVRRAEARAMQQSVVHMLGGIARPAHVYVVNALPKTRSGKLLRRSLQALAQGTDPGDLSTLDDPTALEEVRAALLRGPDS